MQAVRMPSNGHQLFRALLLFWALVVVSAQSQPASGGSAGPAAQQSVAPLLKDVYKFWLTHGQDKQFGGFHGALDRQGRPMSPTSKFIVQQARHLWAFSSLLLAGPERWGFSSKDVRAAADSTYDFMRKYMLKDVPGGKLFVFSVARDGKADNPKVNVYGNAFAIYGLAAYARATGSAEARDLALGTFKTLDKLYHSPFGGYDESSTDFSLDSIPLTPQATPAASGGSSKVVEEAGAKSQPKLSQSFNTLLHVAEALTELSKAVKGADPLVTSRLQEVVQLQTGPLVIRPKTSGPNTPKAFIGPNYDPRTWAPVGNSYSNFGHNIEAAWLLADAVDELQAVKAIDATKANGYKVALREIGEAAVAVGYDDKYGGMFDGSNLGAATPTSPNKIWWSQAEGLLGFNWLRGQTGKAEYSRRIQQTLAFIQAHLLDKQYGEWYWQVGPSGGAPLPYNAGDVDFAATVKGNAWKASYHTGRALLRLAQAGL